MLEPIHNLVLSRNQMEDLNEHRQPWMERPKKRGQGWPEARSRLRRKRVRDLDQDAITVLLLLLDTGTSDGLSARMNF